jgi:sugar (pentulose or hexulose) kinase
MKKTQLDSITHTISNNGLSMSSVALDKNGEKIYSHVTWNDFETAHDYFDMEAAFFEKYIHELYKASNITPFKKFIISLFNKR